MSTDGTDVAHSSLPVDARYRMRTIALDLGVIGAVAASLAGIHYLVPPTVQTRLALHTEAVNAYALFTSTFVHADDAHLVANLAGYVAGAGVTYVLCLQAGQRRWFYATFAAFLLVLPMPVSVVGVLALQAQYPEVPLVSRGFSGVVAGFAGFVLVALLAYLRTVYDRSVARYVGSVVVLLLLGELCLIHAPEAASLGASLLVLGAVVTRSRFDWTVGRRVVTIPDVEIRTLDIVQIALVMLVLLELTFGLFPGEYAVANGITDVFSHLVGLVFGVTVAGVLHRIVADDLPALARGWLTAAPRS